MQEITYQKAGKNLHPRDFADRHDLPAMDATMVFSDASANEKGDKMSFAVVIGLKKKSRERSPNSKGKANQQTYSGIITTATDVNGAEAEAMRQGIIKSQGDIILVTDNSAVARFAGCVFKGTETEWFPGFTQPAMMDLREALLANRDRIDAIFFASQEHFSEQKQAHKICKNIIKGRPGSSNPGGPSR